MMGIIKTLVVLCYYYLFYINYTNVHPIQNAIKPSVVDSSVLFDYFLFPINSLFQIYFTEVTYCIRYDIYVLISMCI